MMDVQTDNIKKIVEQILENYKAPQSSNQAYKTLILIPDYVSDENILLKVLKEDKQNKAIAIAKPLNSSAANDVNIIDVNDENNQDMLMRGLAQCMEYIIVTPGPGFLKRASQFDDRCFFCHLTFRAMAGGKKVSIFTDINKEVIRKKAFEDIGTALESLEDMGAELIYADSQVSEEQSRKSGLLTEKDIIDAYHNNNNEIRVNIGCIVTPLAYDTARDKNIQIIRES